MADSAVRSALSSVPLAAKRARDEPLHHAHERLVGQSCWASLPTRSSPVSTSFFTTGLSCSMCLSFCPRVSGGTRKALGKTRELWKRATRCVKQAPSRSGAR